MIQPLIIPEPALGMVRLMADMKTPYGTVPSWFLYDGASIPGVAWNLTYTPFDPIVLGPAGWHDLQYLTHQYPRDFVDIAFHSMLIKNGANPFKAHMMLSALQSFGGLSWGNTEKDKVRLMELYQVCRDRENFKDYGFPAWLEN